MSAAVTRVVVSVRALEPALAFYRDLLGLKAELTPGFVMLTAGNGVQVLLHERESVASDLSVAATFTLPGLDTACESWAAQGGTVVDEPITQPWGERMAVVRDADGHLVCLVESTVVNQAPEDARAVVVADHLAVDVAVEEVRGEALRQTVRDS